MQPVGKPVRVIGMHWRCQKILNELTKCGGRLGAVGREQGYSRGGSTVLQDLWYKVSCLEGIGVLNEPVSKTIKY